MVRAHQWSPTFMVPESEKIFKNYPFEKLEPPVELIEGCREYDGTIGDGPGKSHNGIDYVRRKGKKFLSFDVFSCHEGEAFQAVSESWGKLVNVRQKVGNIRFETIYVHLDRVSPKIPFLPKDKKVKIKFVKVRAGEWLGTAGTSGNTGGVIQLHLEMHRKDLKTGKREAIDPYGVYARVSSGRYPQPGESLAGLNHYFTSDNPLFVRERR